MPRLAVAAVGMLVSTCLQVRILKQRAIAANELGPSVSLIRQYGWADLRGTEQTIKSKIKKGASIKDRYRLVREPHQEKPEQRR